MVRLYCLTRIYKIEPNKYYFGEKVIPYKDGADENLLAGNKDEITAAINLRRDFSRYYEFTEISIGYKYVNNRKIYLMYFFRDDTRLVVIRMIRGAVRHRQATPNALDFTISTSTLFPGKTKFDLFMRIRWIKNSPTGQSIIDKEEENLYRVFAEIRKNEQISTCSGDECESAFEEIKFEMFNPSDDNVLRTKMSRFLTLIKCLCDPSIGSYKNPPSGQEYNQEVKCYLAERSWEATKLRTKEDLNKKADNFRNCREMYWKNFSMDKHNTDEIVAENVMLASFHNVEIFDSNKKMYSNFKEMFLREGNFVLLQQLTLSFCYIPELSDEFFEILPKNLEILCCNGNKITKISTKISNLIQLKDLELNYNKDLTDVGIPWDSLPPTLVHLKMQQTNITQIPSQIQRLQCLKTLEFSSQILKYVEWCEINDSIERLIVEGGNQLNEIELTSKINLKTLHVLQTGLTEIDFSKLPSDIDNFKMSNNQFKIFDAKNNLENIETLYLIKNGLELIIWENLSINLRTLYIERNKLTSIDDGISQLSQLNNILAGYNNIRQISDKFWRLQQLSSLNLEKNEISTLPRCFELLLNLRHLDLSRNKFDYQQTDILESLWKRLPRNLQILRLGSNSLHSLPCWLKKYNLTDLQVDDCKLTHICPNLFAHRQEQSRNLNIERNKEIKFLPFIPLKIYHPNFDDNDDEICENASNFTIFIDSQMLIGKPISSREPVYQFTKKKNVNLGCKCCVNCGNETEENVIEQLMIMDFDLKISKDQKADDIDEEHPSDTMRLFLPPATIDLPHKRTEFSAGKWQTVIRTRLCVGCMEIVKTRISESEKSKDTKKYKTNNDEIDNTEFNIPLSSHLLLNNLNGCDSFLNAVINLFDAIKPLKFGICNENSGTPFQNELTKILQRKIYNVQNLRNMIPQYSYNNVQDNISSAILNLIEFLTEKIKELFQFAYTKREFCMCGPVASENFSQCFFLSLFVGNLLTSFETFETMLNRWYKFEAKFCFLCRSNTMQKPSINITEKQKYLIVEMDSWIKVNKNKGEQCFISSENFNIDSQQIFDKNWKLIAAIQSNSFDSYSTWRRFEDSWIIITDHQFRIENNLLADFKDYKIFLFEKLPIDAENSDDDEIFSQLDHSIIKVCKNTTYAAEEPVVTNDNSFNDSHMEIDEIYYDNPQPTIAYENPIIPAYYPAEEMLYQEPNYASFIPLNPNYQNSYVENYSIFVQPQNYTFANPQMPQNSNNTQNGIFNLQPMNSSNDYEQIMDNISLYPVQESDEDFWFWNPQNGPL